MVSILRIRDPSPRKTAPHTGCIQQCGGMRSREYVHSVQSLTYAHGGVRDSFNSVSPWVAKCLVVLFVVLGFVAPDAILAQTDSETPKTSPQTIDILPSYEGQNVTTIEIAGQPDLRTSQFASDILQHVGEPFEGKAEYVNR